MSCQQIMTTNYVVCTPASHLCDLQKSWEHALRYAVVLDGRVPKGVIPSSMIRGLGPTDQINPACTAGRSVLRATRCDEHDGLGHVGAKILRDRAYAALVYRNVTLVGVIALLDVLQSLLIPATINPYGSNQSLLTH